MTAPANGHTDDIVAVLGIRSRAGTAVAAVAWLSFLVLGFTSGSIDDPDAYFGGFVAVAFGWWLVLASPGDPMRLTDAAIATATGPVAAGLATWAVEPSSRPALIALGAAPALTLAMLAIRGRAWSAWLGGALIAATIAAIGLWGDVDIETAATVIIPGTVGVLAMVTFFASLARPRAAQIAALRRLGERDREAEGARQIRDARVVRLQTQVRPLLEYIASGQRLSDDQVAVCLLVEAGLRDRIRAPGLNLTELVDAAWDARARGVRVVLLDDREVQLPGSETPLTAKVADAAVGALIGARSGAQVTVRLLPERRDGFATIAIAEEGQVRRIDFPAADLDESADV
ncbi:hypothetical protein [Gordonia sp. (in: high G+C Gram-positive bacteria)]|uniref:hypothetical protein n=1 Tax=Gordonia sp. (in: high G+C Gram-positive bacteria) TaxID=84139 RepID=UPI003C790A28